MFIYLVACSYKRLQINGTIGKIDRYNSGPMGDSGPDRPNKESGPKRLYHNWKKLSFQTSRARSGHVVSYLKPKGATISAIQE